MVKIDWIWKKQEDVIQSQEKNQLIESDPQMSQILELAEKKFKAAVLTILKDFKENKAEK